MKISEIIDLLGAEIFAGKNKLDMDVCSACGSDMMSDVLAFVKEQAVLLTGLVNNQVIRTCHMMDIRCVVFVRDKKPSEDIINLAVENDMVILSTNYRMYDACGILYLNGLRGGKNNE